MKLIIHCDGGARGNPGPAAGAFVVFDKSGQVIYQQGKYIGEGTNNQAEYGAVWLAVNWLGHNHPLAEVEFRLDSQLVINQLLGQFKIKKPHLKKMYSQIHNLILEKKLKIIKFTYVPRDKNFFADNLVNQTLDAKTSS